MFLPARFLSDWRFTQCTAPLLFAVQKEYLPTTPKFVYHPFRPQHFTFL